MQLLKINLLPNFKQGPKNKLLKTRNNDVNHMKLAKLSTPDKRGNNRWVHEYTYLNFLWSINSGCLMAKIEIPNARCLKDREFYGNGNLLECPMKIRGTSYIILSGALYSSVVIYYHSTE